MNQNSNPPFIAPKGQRGKRIKSNCKTNNHKKATVQFDNEKVTLRTKGKRATEEGTRNPPFLSGLG